MGDGQGPRIERLKRRRDFLRVASGAKAAMPGLVLQAAPRRIDDSAVGVGFTVTRKVGGAVVRNRVRRRLKEAARRVLVHRAPAGYDLVVIGRAATVYRPFALLERDLERALARLTAGKAKDQDR